ncbi:RusA family crossover junction endodeoxyribonuclease [Cohnella lubricantis]|uniref:RusA family crossover junction endodeoxyribonuclease n=1 Tax=Cohnella lubricantis TaxID=2163172 RepID=UPI002892A610|nr:RusA family crossover junction endodeoxyribonuclease [Cohnella lubricantis]MBP2117095.1 crossover junction endodeoxyribonuclease RusA [Cohnella lubricantis]
MRLTIPGTTPSVNHMYKDKWIKGRKYRVLTDEAQAWADEAVLLAKSWRNRTRWSTPEGKVVVNLWFFFPDNRKRDTHNGQKLLLDCLEAAGIYENDRYALPRIMDWEIDRANPRIELEIFKLQEVAS